MRTPTRFSILGIVLGFIFSTVVTAADLDWAAAKLRYEQQQAIADQAEANYKRDNQELQRAQSKLMNEISRENTLRSNVGSYETELSNLNSQIARAESDIPVVEGNLRSAESQRDRERQAISRFQMQEQREEREMRRSEGELRRAERELADEKGKAKPDENRVAQLEQEVQRASQDFQRNRNQHERAERELRECQNRVRTLESEVISINNDLIQRRSNLAQLNRRRQDAVQSLQSARDDLRRQGDEVRMAEGRVADERRQVSNSKADFDRQTLLAQQAYRYYQTVVDNYNAERSRVISAAQNLGFGHGSNEAADRAPAPGAAEGSTVAARVGLASGNGEARIRQTNDGYRAGRSTPTQDPVSYKTGTDEGIAMANRKAIAEDYPRGYNDALAATLASDPSANDTTTLPEVASPATPGAEDGGEWLYANQQAVQSAPTPAFGMPTDPAYKLPPAPATNVAAPNADRRFFGPNCGGVVLAEFGPLCQSSYESAYLDGYARTYRKIFGDNYLAAFNAQIKSEYDAALKQAYPAEYGAALSKAAKEQGILDGFASRLAVARGEQYTLGGAAWASYLASGHLIRAQTAALEETSGDTLFTPGEKASMAVIVDNLGGKVAPAGTLSASLKQATGMAVAADARALPRLAAGTRTTVKGALYGALAANQAGAQLALQANLNRGLTALSTLEAKATVHFPVELQSITLAKVPKVEETVDATLRFKNLLTAKTAATPLAMSVVPGFATVVGTGLQIPELEAGAETDVAVKVKPGVWVGRNTAVGFVAETENLGGITGKIAQQFPQKIEVDRVGSLLLFDWNGREIPSSSLTVQAGGIARFQSQFTFQGKVAAPGPFVLAASTVSDPGIRLVPNSTISVNYGQVWPGRKFDSVAFQYNIPATLKGKSGYILIALSEGSKLIHVQQIMLDIR
jgi:hypothetical protein